MEIVSMLRTIRTVFPMMVISSVIVGVTLLVPGCRNKSDDFWPEDHHGPKIVVSFAPYYSFVASVAGEDAVVRTVMTTAGPHHFNPSDRDAKLLRRADILFINGLGLDEAQADIMKRGSGNRNLRVVDLGGRIPPNMLLEGSCHHDHDTNHPHQHGNDPHVWLSPDYAILLVEGIRDELKELDPTHAANYDRRASDYINRLRQLKEHGVALLKPKQDRNIVTFHDSLTYFAKTFDLNIVGVVQKNPGTEPSDKALKQLIALCADEQHPVRIITVEPQYSTSNSGHELIKILQHKKVPDPKLVEIDPLETCPADALTADWYEQRMRANLEALAREMR
jgi:ABC-type Zn uptake system ZnuABC Zn-binding protein ZnuA